MVRAYKYSLTRSRADPQLCPSAHRGPAGRGRKGPNAGGRPKTKGKGGTEGRSETGGGPEAARKRPKGGREGPTPSSPRGSNYCPYGRCRRHWKTTLMMKEVGRNFGGGRERGVPDLSRRHAHRENEFAKGPNVASNTSSEQDFIHQSTLNGASDAPTSMWNSAWPAIRRRGGGGGGR